MAFIAVGNLKGGVGKTTLAVHLACELASSVTTFAVVDAEPLSGYARATACPFMCTRFPLSTSGI